MLSQQTARTGTFDSWCCYCLDVNITQALGWHVERTAVDNCYSFSRRTEVVNEQRLRVTMYYDSFGRCFEDISVKNDLKLQGYLTWTGA
jgi:hypothetical protein